MDDLEFPIKGWPKGLGSAKRSGRMCTSLGGKCLGEPGWAKFSESQERLIKVQAREPYK